MKSLAPTLDSDDSEDDDNGIMEWTNLLKDDSFQDMLNSGNGWHVNPLIVIEFLCYTGKLQSQSLVTDYTTADQLSELYNLYLGRQNTTYLSVVLQ